MIEKIIKNINARDERDFYTVLEQSKSDHARFENHWPYIIQATRGSGYVLKLNKTRLYYYCRTQPNGAELVIVNGLGNQAKEGALMLKDYSLQNNMPICIKNIPMDDLSEWIKLGFCEKHTPWSTYSNKDDNSYPECIYNLHDIAEAHIALKPESIRACRASHSNKIRRFLKDRHIQVQTYDSNLHKNEVFSLLTHNAEFLQKKGVDSKQNVIDAHKFVFQDNISYKVRLIHLEDGAIIGFNYMTVYQNVIFGNALIHQNQPDLMRFLVWQGFNYLYHQLDKNTPYFVTLQGSENQGQYHWKKGFAPLREISKTHITWPQTSKGSPHPL